MLLQINITHFIPKFTNGTKITATIVTITGIPNNFESFFSIILFVNNNHKTPTHYFVFQFI